MPTSNGPWQNHRRVEWSWSVPAATQDTTAITASVYAYLRAEVGWDESYTGSKAWSGHWGSGSAAQPWNFSRGGERVLIVNGGGAAVTLTDVPQTRAFAASAAHYFGSTGSSITVTYPARYARIPTDLTVTRVSDSQQTLAWTRGSTYTGAVVQRRENGGAWQEIGRPTGNAASFTDTTTVADKLYEYRVAGLNSNAADKQGQSKWSATASVHTSPSAPTGVQAVRSGTDIDVSVASVPMHATSYDVRDGDTIIQSDVSLPWTHVAPNPAVPHTYRLRGVVDGIAGAWSEPSNTVQLIAKPNPPTGLTPNGGVAASDGPVRLAFTHNPVDSSAQTAYELRHRAPAGAWTTLSGTTAAFRDVTLGLGDREWQVRTKGAHADWSDWSAVATVTVITRPGVAVTQPDTEWAASVLTAMWSWNQAQARPQSSWEAELLDADDTIVEARSGSGATGQVTFNRRVSEGEWTVRVRAATGGVWSARAVSTFTVAFDPPATPTLEGAWEELAGGVALALAAGIDDEAPETIRLTLERSIDDGDHWEQMIDTTELELALMDWESLSRGTTLYRATAYTLEGATAEIVLPVTATSLGVWLSGGPGFEVTARLPFEPVPTITAGRARTLKRYAGRSLPVAYSGEALTRTVQVAGTTTDRALSDEQSASVEQLTRVAQVAAPVHLFRDPDGRRIYGVIGEIQMPREGATPDGAGWNGIWGYGFTLEESGR